MGSTCCSEHQLSHFFQALSYALFVPLLHPAAKSWEVSPEIPAASCLCWIVSRRLDATGLLPSVGADCWRGPPEDLSLLGGSGGNLLGDLAELDTKAGISILEPL